MLRDLKRTAKHTAVYAIGNIATKLIGLVLIPLYTDPKYLSPVDFGALTVFEATVQLLVGVLTMAMIQSLTRWYWDEKYRDQQKSIFFTSISFLLFTVLPIIIVASLFSGQISHLLFQDSLTKTVDYSFLLKLTFFTAGLQILNNQTLCLAKLQSRSFLYTGILILKLLLTLGLILWGILIKDMGLKAIWQAYLIAELAIFVINIPYVLRNIVIKFHFSILYEMLSYGFPLMLASVSGVLLATADRYMLNSIVGLEKTGIYSLGFRIANTLKVVISMSLALSLSPLRMKKINESNNQRFYSKMALYSSYIFVLGLLALSLFALEGLKIFTGSKIYWEANNIVPIISFALLIGLIKDNVIIALSIKKKTKITGTLIFITGLLNIGLNLLLIPHYDIYGAAAATLLSQIFFFISVTIAAQRIYFIPYEWRKILTLILLSLAIVCIGIAIADLAVELRLLIKVGMLISFPFLLYVFNFYEEVELENIRSIFRNWAKPRKFKENLQRFLK